MNPNDHKNFESRVRFFRAGHGGKIRRAPVRLLRTTAVGLAAHFLKGGITTKAKILTGDEMTVVLPEEVSTALYRYGFYEEGLTRMLMERLKPGMTFFDVGAHFGYYSLLSSDLVGNSGRVHSFEPTPSTFKVLSTNVKNRSNVQINQVAVSSEHGVAQFNDLGLVFSGRNSLHRAKVNQSDMDLNRQFAYEIQTTTIDKYCQETGQTPDVLKIDAESSEFEILQGASGLISEKKPVITLEVGDDGIEGVPTSRELVEYLIDQGYKAFEFNAASISKHKLRDRYDWDNLLFLEA